MESIGCLLARAIVQVWRDAGPYAPEGFEHEVPEKYLRLEEDLCGRG